MPLLTIFMPWLQHWDSIGYDIVLRIDTSLANAQIERFKDNYNVFVQFAGDKLDFIEETLDGKGTFQVTQIAVFQQGQKALIARSQVMSYVPEGFHHLATVEVPPNHVPQRIPGSVQGDFFLGSGHVTQPYRQNNIAFILSRHQHQGRQSVPVWTGYNQTVSKVKSTQTITGYLPIIPAPAHEMDTMMTVLLHCKDTERKLY